LISSNYSVTGYSPGLQPKLRKPVDLFFVIEIINFYYLEYEYKVFGMMQGSLCKIERAFQAGGRQPNEDHLCCKQDLFAVFDGSSSLTPQLYSGQTGAWWASYLAGSEFSKNNAPLFDLGDRANRRLKTAMSAAGVPADDRLACWSASAAAVRIDEDYAEWLQIGDCQVVAIAADGSYQLLTSGHNHDRPTLLHLKGLIERNVPSPHQALRPHIEAVRLRMNREYGVLNGDIKAADFFSGGKIPLTDIRHLLLFTDGLLPPLENPEQEHDIDRIVALYLEGGLALVQQQVRLMEASDPDCSRYPRFKRHDDIAAIALSLQ